MKETRWKTWNSYDINGNSIITSLTENDVIEATRWYLKNKYETNIDTKTYSGEVSGKL